MFIGPSEVDETEVRPFGTFTTHPSLTHSKDLSDVLIVQPGLPGTWIKHAQDKTQALLQEREDVAVAMPFPEGTRLEGPILSMGPTDAELLEQTSPQHFQRPFSLDKYARLLFATYKALRDNFDPECKVHLAGQSYGAAALLYALRKCLDEGIHLPASAHFLAPFVKIATDTDDPSMCLSIIHAGVSEIVDTSSERQIAELRALLESLGAHFNLNHADPVQAHAETFGRRFMLGIGDLSRVVEQGCRVSVVRGARDPYIGPEHSNLIARRVQSARGEITTVLDGDTHNLESLRFRDLI